MSMIGNFRRVPDARLLALLEDPESVVDFLEEQGFSDLDVDKAWHGLHYLFTGTAWERRKGARRGRPPSPFGEDLCDGRCRCRLANPAREHGVVVAGRDRLLLRGGNGETARIEERKEVRNARGPDALLTPFGLVLLGEIALKLVLADVHLLLQCCLRRGCRTSQTAS